MLLLLRLSRSRKGSRRGEVARSLEFWRTNSESKFSNVKCVAPQKKFERLSGILWYVNQDCKLKYGLGARKLILKRIISKLPIGALGWAIRVIYFKTLSKVTSQQSGLVIALLTWSIDYRKWQQWNNTMSEHSSVLSKHWWQWADIKLKFLFIYFFKLLDIRVNTASIVV